MVVNEDDKHEEIDRNDHVNHRLTDVAELLLGFLEIFYFLFAQVRVAIDLSIEGFVEFLLELVFLSNLAHDRQLV